MAVVAAQGHGHEAAHGGISPELRLRMNRAGLWLFFFSESIIFGLLLSSRFFLEGIGGGEVDQALGLVVTIVLLLSSVTAYTAETAMEQGRRRLCAWMLIATILLGAAFAVGVGFEWKTAPFSRHESFGTVFFTMTGIHASHVMTGLIFLSLNWYMIVKGHFSPKSHFGVSAVIMYWHFVDIVWVFFYPALYLVHRQ